MHCRHENKSKKTNMEEYGENYHNIYMTFDSPMYVECYDYLMDKGFLGRRYYPFLINSGPD